MSDFELEIQDVREKPIEQKIEEASRRISAAVKLFKPIGVFGLFSGGHDSICAYTLASFHPEFRGAVHINTGIGVEATRDFVRETCRRRGHQLFEYKALENRNSLGEPDPMDYEREVLKEGFPGPGQHNLMYSKLKERALRCFERDQHAKARKRVLLYVTGARSQESKRRMGNTQPQYVDGRRVWVNAIHDWSKLDTTRFMEMLKIDRNRVVDLIHKSGECLCGAFAENGELHELSLWPETRPAYDRIVKLQEKVIAAGHPWGWEDRPPEALQEEKKGQVLIEPMRQFLCWGCHRNAAIKPPQRAATAG